MSATYPFTAILGQEAMQTALLISAVDPSTGGVLIRGQKGTAKSTAARALADLLPSITVVANCPFHCDPDIPEELHAGCRDAIEAGKALPQVTVPTPFVDLPLSTTEDRLVGTLHLQNTLTSGERQFEAGLLAAAHRGVLYVDEVNLLPDHLVDLLLDCAASGRNLVEREGLQFSHAARFVLVGTMNPEEGELRPQFLDRFGLCVTINNILEPALRGEIVKHRLAFDLEQAKLVGRYRPHQDALRKQVTAARKRLATVQIPEEVVHKAVQIASAARVQGHRAELAMIRSARALAALMDRKQVTLEELREVTPFALAHRFPGASVLTADEINRKLSDALASPLTKTPPGPAFDHESDDKDEFPLIDNMDFPGSAAAGSMLFTYLKKKLKTAISVSTSPST